MNFFQHQQAARFRTVLLLLYFVMAVLVLLPLGYGVLLGAGRLMRNVHNFFGAWTDVRNRFEPLSHPGWWDATLFAWVTGTGLLLMAGGTGLRLYQLAGGGCVVAGLLGGERIPTATTDPAQRRLLNVVEEMAIAAGLPLPVVYVLKRQCGINAFAAGWTPDDAVITVTQGCLETLSRDELQGVIAHEFSHILNGDTRLKTLLSGLLHGIAFPADLARWTAEEMVRCEPVHAALAMVAFLILGFVTLPLLLIIQTGAMLAALIKRLLSRQRELLADAFAVQFTRHPDGLAGALKKVGGLAAGGRILDRHAREISHLFFVDALGRAQVERAGLCAAHPPLAARIRRLDADFSGTFAVVPSRRIARDPTAEPFRAVAKRHSQTVPFPVDHGAITASIGAPAGAHVEFAAALLEAMPATLVSTLHDPAGAESILYALLLSDEPAVRQAQLQHLREAATPHVYDATIGVLSLLPLLPAGRRLPLVAIAVNSLKQVPAGHYRLLRSNLQALIAADCHVSLFEYALQRTVLRHLGPAFGEAPPGIAPAAGKSMLLQGRDLLACLAYWGTYDILDQDQAFRIGIAKLTPDGMEAPPILAYDDCTVERFGCALEAVVHAPSRFKQRLIDACVACIAANHKTSPQEAECLQVIADALGCPMPPILPPAEGAGGEGGGNQ